MDVLATLLAFSFVVAIFLFLVTLYRGGPRIVVSEALRVAFARPRSKLQWLVKFVWVLVTLRFCYIIFVQPHIDSEIRREYASASGGLIGVSMALAAMYLPWLLIYLWCAFYFTESDAQ